MQPLITLDPSDAKHLAALLEKEAIPFELSADDSALLMPGREVMMSLGMYPEGSKIVVSVPEDKAAKATELLNQLFPV